MNFRKILITSFLFLMLTSFLPAQSFKPEFFSSETHSEVQLSDWDTEKHYIAGITGALGFNLCLATYNRYVIGSGWAKTGWEQWDHFWERELTWDRDWYWTNFFLHPYQGSMYYMSCRGANMNPAESMVVTVLGSAFWEYLCECNAPSKNDMIYTTIGSFCVGEMFFRLSQEAGETSRLLATAINPTRLWTEQVWRIRQPNTTGRLYNFDIGVALGNTVAGTKIDGISPSSATYKSPEVYPVYAGLFLNIDYRDPYTHDSNSPYDQFSLNVQGEIGKGSGEKGLCAYESYDAKLFYNIRIFSDAMLLARTLNLGENKDTSVGITMIYDFDWHSYYMLSSLAPGFAFKQRINFQDSKLLWQAQAGAIILGTEDYFYYHRKVTEIPKGTIRSYSMTTGAEALFKCRWEKSRGTAVGVNFRGYAMYDFYDQIQTENESTGWEYVGILTANFELPVSKNVSLGAVEEVYGKAALYKKVPDVYQIVNTAKVYAKLKLK